MYLKGLRHCLPQMKVIYCLPLCQFLGVILSCLNVGAKDVSHSQQVLEVALLASLSQMLEKEYD